MRDDFDIEDAGERMFNAVVRTAKAAVLAAVLFISLHIAGVRFPLAATIAMIPLLLSILNVLPRLGNLAAMLVAIFTIGWTLAPDDVKTAVLNILPS